MNKETKVLYIMNVDWCWIRQRPHILAQLLDKQCDLTVLYPKFLTRPWRRQRETKKTKKCKGIFQIPFCNKNTFLGKIEEYITKYALRDIYKYDFIWLSTPFYVDYIPDDYGGKIIYDNMDDIVNIQSNPEMARLLYIKQEKLFLRADRIVVTSQYLLQHMNALLKNKTVLVRNGAFTKIIQPYAISKQEKRQYSLGYIGTISEWFDFPLISSLLSSTKQCRVELFGPNIVKIPKIAGMYTHGIVEYEQLSSIIQDIDCLIMPFLLNDVTLAVDPVKLYEYIGFGKCIVSIKYPEIERFEPFVYFYENASQFMTLIQRLLWEGFPPKYNAALQKNFLKNNSWEKRMAAINAILTELQNKD